MTRGTLLAAVCAAAACNRSNAAAPAAGRQLPPPQPPPLPLRSARAISKSSSTASRHDLALRGRSPPPPGGHDQPERRSARRLAAQEADAVARSASSARVVAVASAGERVAIDEKAWNDPAARSCCAESPRRVQGHLGRRQRQRRRGVPEGRTPRRSRAVALARSRRGELERHRARDRRQRFTADLGGSCSSPQTRKTCACGSNGSATHWASTTRAPSQRVEARSRQRVMRDGSTSDRVNAATVLRSGGDGDGHGGPLPTSWTRGGFDGVTSSRAPRLQARRHPARRATADEGSGGGRRAPTGAPPTRASPRGRGFGSAARIATASSIPPASLRNRLLSRGV